jgi:hypothetical protein
MITSPPDLGVCTNHTCQKLDQHCEPNSDNKPNCFGCADVIYGRNRVGSEDYIIYRNITCYCFEHVGCRSGEFCNTERRDNDLPGKGQGYCEDCDNCGFRSSSSCPKHCLCRSSDDCQKDYFCSTHPDADFKPPGSGVCQSCYPGGCAADILANSSSEACPEVCPDQPECVTHMDCGKKMWCSKWHLCQLCDFFDFFVDCVRPPQEAIDSICPTDKCCGMGMDRMELIDTG